jgi:hypothetical protein
MTTTTTAAAERNDGWSQSSTCRAVEEAGRSAGQAYGEAEAKSRTLARLLKRQAKQKFGSDDGGGRATLDGLAQAFAGRELEQLAERLLTTADWSAWLAGVVVPPPAPGMPEYTKNLDIDFEPSSPAIDTHMEATLMNGTKTFIHLRLQKWFQPDLDRHLFESSRKLERKYGTMPMVLVFLMWPPAEGPGMTGKFEEHDAQGNVKRVFTYTIKRAWELEPEEVMHGLGTMLLAPLTRGAKQRMP